MHVANVSPEEVCQERERLLKEFQLTVVTVFDTPRKTGGLKDVVGCVTADGRRVILRIGERRPDWFYPDGFVGDTFYVPRQYSFGGEKVPFEIEEWVEGQMVCEHERDWSRRGQMSPEMQNRLIAVFWEFQMKTADLPFESFFTEDRILAHAQKAEELVPLSVFSAIESTRSFWNDVYPSKWKFATDNLIEGTNGKIVLIDNAKVGSRYFGYDLGFLIWPRWFEMDTGSFHDVESHVAYLDDFCARFIASAPPHVRVPEDLRRAFHLMLFERLIGALYDIKQEVRHVVHWGMVGEEGRERREAHVAFLQSLLHVVMSRLFSTSL